MRPLMKLKRLNLPKGDTEDGPQGVIVKKVQIPIMKAEPKFDSAFAINTFLFLNRIRIMKPTHKSLEENTGTGDNFFSFVLYGSGMIYL